MTRCLIDPHAAEVYEGAGVEGQQFLGFASVGCGDAKGGYAMFGKGHIRRQIDATLVPEIMQ